jgi:hypothetical protein
MLSSFVIYLLKANLSILFFYAVYRYLLRSLTFYRLNRYYLLFSILFAAGYPLIDIQQWVQQSPQIVQSISSVSINLEKSGIQQHSSAGNDWVKFLFAIPAASFLLLFIIKLLSVWRIHLRSSPAKWSTYIFRQIPDNIAPFSFWKTIYLNPENQQEDDLEKIFKHEEVHISQLHSFDILIAELSLVLFSYNPACWLMRRSIRENLEFLTDQEVLQKGVDKKSYQYSLLHLAVPMQQPGLGNHFNLKNLKKRIIMMNKKRTPHKHLAKYLFILPAIALSLLIINTSEANEIKNVVVGAKSPVKHQIAKKDTIKADEPLLYIDNKIQPFALFKRLDQNEIASIEVLKDDMAIQKAGVKGKHGVIMITTKSGNLAKSLKAKSNQNENEELQESLKEKIVIGRKKETDTNVQPHQPEAQAQTSLRLPVNDNVLIYVNGKKTSKSDLEKIKPDDIESINVLKGQSAIKTYGDGAKEGVIEVKLKE